MFVLLFLTPVFEKLTYNTMAAIIIVGVAGLVEIEEAVYLFKVRPCTKWAAHQYTGHVHGMLCGVWSCHIKTCLYKGAWCVTTKCNRLAPRCWGP
jgi:hypothetical protein